MDELFAEFMMEKEYVCGLSKTTLKGYWVTWRTFKRFIKEPTGGMWVGMAGGKWNPLGTCAISNALQAVGF